jgi:hypothetical protein
MRRFGWTVAFLIALSGTAGAADPPDPLARARLLYNEGKWDAALMAADQARANPARIDGADLIAARAYLERFREKADADDLTNARERLRRVNSQRFGSRERLEFIVGLGEALYLDGSYGAAADIFDSVLEQGTALAGAERERVIDWWATALDRDARPRNEFDRQAVYQRIRERMHRELGVTLTSTVAVYWLSAAARGQGDLQGAWDAAQAGWVRAPLAGDRGNALRADLDRLVLGALIPERARAIGQPPATLRQEWERFKELWTNETPP